MNEDEQSCVRHGHFNCTDCSRQQQLELAEKRAQYWEQRAGELQRSMNFYASEADELRRFREREQAVMDALDDFEVFGRGGSYHIKGMLRLRDADKAVRDFGRCIVGASTDEPAAADLAHGEPIGATESLKKASDEP